MDSSPHITSYCIIFKYLDGFAVLNVELVH